MSIPREDSDGAVPSATAPEPLGGASPEEMEVREDLTIEAKDIREAIRFGHADAKERFREFDERCETAGWGRRIADRLFQALHRGDMPQGPSTLLMSLAATVRAFREPMNWLGPARRALERLGSLPEAAAVQTVFEAERAARVRKEKYESAVSRIQTMSEHEREESRRIQRIVRPLPLIWERMQHGELEARIDSLGVPDDIRHSVLDAYSTWIQACEAAESGEQAFATMQQELNDLPYSLEQTSFERTELLHPLNGVEAIAEINNQILTLRKLEREFATWPKTKSALGNIPQQLHRSPNRLDIKITESRAAKIGLGPLLANVVFGNSEERNELRSLEKRMLQWAEGLINACSSWCNSDSEMSSLLAEVEARRNDLSQATTLAIQTLVQVQGLRALFSKNRAEADQAKRKALIARMSFRDAVLTAYTRHEQLTELQRISNWRKQSFEILSNAIQSAHQQVAEKRRQLTVLTEKAKRAVNASLGCLMSWANRLVREELSCRTNLLAAIRNRAKEVELEWNAAKAATDEAIAQAEKEEKRRAGERLQFARLKDRTIPEIRKRIETVREVSAVMPEIAERLEKLEDDLSVWDGKNAPAGGNLEEENSFAAQLMERANALAEDGRKAVELVAITRKACAMADEAHVDNDAPPFATAEMATVRMVFEIIAHQTDWKKSEKAACILEKAEERKRRLDALVCEWRKLARRLDEIGRLEERTEAVWRGLLWRNPSFAPRRDQMASSVQSSGQFTDALLRITDYTNALNLSLEHLNEERTRQLDSFQAAATERLGESRAILCLHHFEPRPADLFERTRQGSFEDRCCWILDWYELLFSLYGERQRNAMEGGGGSSLPARAFLRLCEIAGTISVKDETVRDLVAKSRDWDALSRQIEEMMPVDEGQNDDGHRRMFEQARTAIHELTELCDDCQVHSVEVQGAFQRLCEASEWIRNNRLPRERTLSARQKIETDFQSLEALDMPIDSAERDQLLGRGDTLLQQSDFQGSRDAFESCHASLAERIRQLSPRLVLRIAMPEEGRTRTTTFSIVSPQGNKIHFDVNEARNQECDKLEPEVVYKTPDFRCYVAGRTSVGTFSNSVDVGLVDWHGIREMDVSLWADRFSFPLSGTVAPLEFRRAPNGLWYCVQAMTMDQFTALVNTEQRRTDNPRGRSKGGRSKVCAGMTWVSANRFAEKVTQKALAEGFRLPDGTTPTFRLPSPEEWGQGSELGTKTFSSVGPAFHEWCTRMDERYAYHCRIIGPSVIRSVERDWDCINDSFPFGRVVDPVGFRLVCDPRP